MRYFISLLFCVLVWDISAQKYAAIDRHALNAPRSAEISIPKLAAYLSSSPAQSDEDRLRAIYAWVTQNIAYADSTDQADLWSTPEDIRRQRAEQVFQNRTAVCLGYSNLFRALAIQAGIPCEVVGGIVKKNDGSIARIGHAWVAAKAGQHWHLFDPTWGIPSATGVRGIVDDRYFMAPPDFFITEHLPDDPMWQLLENPVHEAQFRQSSAGTLRVLALTTADKPFYYQDTLSHWLKMDSVSRGYSAVFRVLHFNSDNERVIFQMGRTFYRYFYDLYITLDTVARDHIYKLQTPMDTARFLQQLRFMGQLQHRAAYLFARLKDRERLDKTTDLPQGAEADALAEKLQGDMWMALLQRIVESAETPSETQIVHMRHCISAMERCYDNAYPSLGRESFENERRDILNHRSIVYLQLGGRHLRLAQNFVDNESWQKKHPKQIEIWVAAAQRRLFQADSLTHQMYTLLSRPWYWGVLQERLVNIRQHQINAAVMETRMATNALRPRLRALFAKDEIEENALKNLLSEMRQVRRLAGIGLDSLEKSKLPLDSGFQKVMAFNLLNDICEMYGEEGNAYYRMAYQCYRDASQTGKLAGQRSVVLQHTDAALAALDKALKTLAKAERCAQGQRDMLSKEGKRLREIKEAVRDLAETVK